MHTKLIKNIMTLLGNGYSYEKPSFGSAYDINNIIYIKNEEVSSWSARLNLDKLSEMSNSEFVSHIKECKRALEEEYAIHN